jgi:hypothetical protein
MCVTPEMVRVGVDLLLDYEWVEGDPAVYAERIYRAMASVSRPGGK